MKNADRWQRRERQPYPVVPNGLACVASALDAAGHEVRFLDLCFEKDAVAAVTVPGYENVLILGRQTDPR